MEQNIMQTRISELSALGEMTPSEYVARLYAHTDENRRLIVPAWNDDGSVRCCHCCEVVWTEADRDRTMEEADTLVHALREIAVQNPALSDSEEENEALLSPAALQVWHTYIRSFDTSAFDRDRIQTIAQMTETVEEIEALREKEELGRPLEAHEITFLNQNSDVTIDPADAQYYEAYRHALEEQSRQRVGDSPVAYRLVMHAKRLCRLMALDKHGTAVRSEQMQLLQTFVFHYYAKSFSAFEYSAN